MKYQIFISSVAEAETDQIFLSISQKLSQERAKDWYKGLLREVTIHIFSIKKTH